MSTLTPRPTSTFNDPAAVDATVTGNNALAFSTMQVLTKTPAPTTNTSTTTIPQGSTTLVVSPTSSTLQDHLIEYTFQIFGITAAIVFGVWSIKSYSTSITANSLSSQSLSLAMQANNIALMSFQQTVYQNLLALLSFCVDNADVRFNETCVEVLEFMAPASATATSGPGGLAIIASAAEAAVGTVLGPTPVSPSEAVPELPFGVIVGTIVAVVVIVGVMSVILLKRTPSRQSLQRHGTEETARIKA
ncbi:hypothetical protein B0H11DRAFT_755375 [Mycena galericulata]|nr:hypothetical protein B0H11DRAFT_755375 [Mycena galericulata]